MEAFYATENNTPSYKSWMTQALLMQSDSTHDFFSRKNGVMGDNNNNNSLLSSLISLVRAFFLERNYSSYCHKLLTVTKQQAQTKCLNEFHLKKEPYWWLPLEKKEFVSHSYSVSKRKKTNFYRMSSANRQSQRASAFGLRITPPPCPPQPPPLLFASEIYDASMFFFVFFAL